MTALTRPGHVPAQPRAVNVRRVVGDGGGPVAASLAVHEWGTPSDAPLDLRYAPDEADLLRPHPSAILADLPGTVEAAEEYPVADPYGAHRGASAVSAFHGVPIAAEQLTFGAGVTALLRDLAGLDGASTVLAPELVHPDLEIWAMAVGRDVLLVDEPGSVPSMVAAIRDIGPGLVHLDRPGFLSTYEWAARPSPAPA